MQEYDIYVYREMSEDEMDFELMSCELDDLELK